MLVDDGLVAELTASNSAMSRSADFHWRRSSLQKLNRRLCSEAPASGVRAASPGDGLVAELTASNSAMSRSADFHRRRSNSLQKLNRRLC